MRIEWNDFVIQRQELQVLERVWELLRTKDTRVWTVCIIIRYYLLLIIY